MRDNCHLGLALKGLYIKIRCTAFEPHIHFPAFPKITWFRWFELILRKTEPFRSAALQGRLQVIVNLPLRGLLPTKSQSQLRLRDSAWHADH